MSKTPNRETGPWARVRNAAIQYLGVGWFLTQVCIVLGRQLGWPSWIGDYLILALGLGFILTLGATVVMARRRTAPRPLKRHLAMAGVAAIAGVVVWLASGGQPGLRSGEFGVVRESRGLFSASTDVHAFIVVHPQQPFRPTGIEVERGQRVSVWADGRINIGLAGLVAAVEDDDVDPYDWVGPDGEVDATGQPVIRRDRGLVGRERCLIQRAFPYGSLMLLISPTDRPTPGTARRLEPGEQAFVVGSHLELEVQARGHLILAINDVYLDSRDCDEAAFDAGVHADKYFLDNIGFFSVNLQMR